MRIRGEIRRTKTLLPKDGLIILNATSNAHRRMLGEIARLKPEDRKELESYALDVQAEGERARTALEWFLGA